jgi:phage tail P2-like protein
MKLKEIDLLKIQTSYMRTDETSIALCKTLNAELNKIDPSKCLIMYKIDTLSEEILDEIAISENIFWYDSQATIEIKREIIKNADEVFTYLGTAYSVERVVADYFGDGEVVEWFNYSGTPGHFKIYTSNTDATAAMVEQFYRAIALIKRKSAVLDEVVVNMVENYNLINGFALHIGDSMTLQQVG